MISQRKQDKDKEKVMLELGTEVRFKKLYEDSNYK